jgi:DNA-directed RNA polymerase specialized sigma24 family protein
MVNNREDAEVLVQEIYEQIIKSTHNGLKSKTNDKIWLFMISKNATMHFLHKQSRWKLCWNQGRFQNRKKKYESQLPNEFLNENKEVQNIYRCLEKRLICLINRTVVFYILKLYL